MPDGLYYENGFVPNSAREEIVSWLESLYPLWEQRFSAHNPPPTGQTQRWLLRPVYWLGNWQFACLNYYRPPKGIHNRCVAAEPFPPAIATLVDKIHAIAHKQFARRDIPPGWHLNTCLVNYYGTRFEGGRKEDTARVGEHKDSEPGPVASLSFGERAYFQFVESQGRGTSSRPVLFQWLEDCSLQMFAGRRWKDQLFHRVQRVENKLKSPFKLHVEGFETRRINLTFRYVPDEHIVPFRKLPAAEAEDVGEYVGQLASHSAFWREAREKRTSSATLP